MTSEVGPLISVIAPCYNHERFVSEALRSVAGQSYPRLELIIVDDASSDESVTVIHSTIAADDFRSRFERVQLIRRRSNGGAHNAINVGLREASGDYITIINTDDRFDHDRISQLVYSVQANNAEWGFSRCSFVDELGEDCSGRHPTARKIESLQRTIKRFPSLGFALLSSNIVATSGNIFMSRHAYDHVGEFSPLKYCHDWDYVLRLLIHSAPVFLDRELYVYRLHKDNSFISLKDVALEESQRVLNDYIGRVERAVAIQPSAPGSIEWPGLFELWCEWRGVPRRQSLRHRS